MPQPAQSQGSEPVRIALILEEREIPVGASTLAQLKIVGGIRYPERVPGEIETSDGLEMVKININYREDFEGGKMLPSTQVLYSITGTLPGAYIIPAIEVKVAGESYRTTPTSLRVISPSSSQSELRADRSYFMKFKAARTEAYVHEQIPIDLELFARGEDSIDKMSQPSVPEFETVDNFIVQPFPVSFKKGSMIIEGLPYTSLTTSTHIASLVPGKRMIGPAQIDVEIKRANSATVYPPNVFPGEEREKRTVTSNELEFLIKPLPAEGQPTPFSDAVGRFDLEVSADTQELQLGDPLDVKITLRGEGNFDSLSPPSFPESTAWKTYPLTRLPSQARTGRRHEISFSQVVIPLETMGELPAIEFSFFDPSEEAYQVVSSTPVPLRFLQGLGETAVERSARLRELGVQAGKLDEILYIRERSGSWVTLAAAQHLRPGIRFWLLQLIFVLILTLVWLEWFRRKAAERRREEAAREEMTLQDLRSHYQKGGLSRERFYRLFLEFLGQYGGGQSWPSEMAPQHRDVLDKVMKAGEAYLFSGVSYDSSSVSSREKDQALRALQEWLRHERKEVAA
ncbi:MAG: hypothetical protein AAF191_07950 [Verrucomicrobiota bacterium]